MFNSIYIYDSKIGKHLVPSFIIISQGSGIASWLEQHQSHGCEMSDIFNTGIIMPCFMVLHMSTSFVLMSRSARIGRYSFPQDALKRGI